MSFLPTVVFHIDLHVQVNSNTQPEDDHALTKPEDLSSNFATSTDPVGLDAEERDSDKSTKMLALEVA